jgi:hypothetical protein
MINHQKCITIINTYVYNKRHEKIRRKKLTEMEREITEY